LAQGTKFDGVSVAILGCMGVPAKYGGFETLAENLVRYHRDHAKELELTVYCSSLAFKEKATMFETARLRYIPLHANGKQAMFYDMWSLIDAALRGTDVVILLGHGGSFVIPILKLCTKTQFITNIDGIEWRREKWTGLARWIIRKSEAMAVRQSHVVLADNEAIREYVANEFDRACEVIPYGGDHALDSEPDPHAVDGLPESYALALCRIEPENNVAMILEAFAEIGTPLVFVGNWDKSQYGRDLKSRYRHHPTIIVHDSIYEPRGLRAIRDQATMYVHGHSAGGTNPSLVEMMHFGIPVFAHGCSFNRYTTEEKARYFMSATELSNALRTLLPHTADQIGADMRDIAHGRYTWEQVGRAYFDLIEPQRGN
jgi:glycosyltransferase involved in cell wall biosynthesis